MKLKKDRSSRFQELQQLDAYSEACVENNEHLSQKIRGPFKIFLLIVVCISIGVLIGEFLWKN